MKSIGETLSSNTLFHFTSQREHIESIIENGFHPRYSTENFAAFAPALGREADKSHEFGVPMVCFCDIPLSKVKEHISVYKGYGIGCSKAWGIAKGISPLIYIDSNSETALAVKEALISLRSLTEISAIDAPYIKAVIGKLIWLIKFTKPYEGRFEHGGEVYESKRFYDEREWRYVPKIPDIENPSISPWIDKYDLTESIKIVNDLFDKMEEVIGAFSGSIPWLYQQAKKDRSLLEFTKEKVPVKLSELYNLLRIEMNERIAQEADYKMMVDPLSIKYIIVEKEDDVMPIIKLLSAKFGDDYSETTMIRLKARVLTLDQIQQDF